MPHITAQPVDHAARTYAQAIFDLADQQDKLQAVAEQLQQLGELWLEQENLRRLLTSRVIGKVERAGAIQRMFEGKLDNLLYRFLQVVNQHDRMSHLPVIVEAFDGLMDQKQGNIEVDLYVAQPLDDPQLEQVKTDISQAMGKTAEVRQYVDESLIGGLKLRIGDRLIDGSVASQLSQMRQRMKTAGRDASRRFIQSESQS